MIFCEFEFNFKRLDLVFKNKYFSNCGYILLGLLLIIMNKEKEYRMRSIIERHPILEEVYSSFYSFYFILFSAIRNSPAFRPELRDWTGSDYGRGSLGLVSHLSFGNQLSIRLVDLFIYQMKGKLRYLVHVRNRSAGNAENLPAQTSGCQCKRREFY